MAATVDVPLNTVIADLDEALRRLLRRELERHGFEGVEIAFDAPSKDWSGKLTSPTRRPVPLRPARGHRARLDVADRARAATARRSMSPAAAAARADLRRDGVDEGRRGRAPAALPGALDPVLATAACRRTCWPRARSAPPHGAGGRRDVGRAAARGEGRFLERGRRPVQGLDRLRGPPRRRVRARAPSVARRCGRRRSGRGSPTARRGRSPSCTGSAARCATPRASPCADAWVAVPEIGRCSADGRGRALPLRPDVAGLASARGAHGGGRAGGGQVLGARRCRRPHAEAKK